MKNNNEAPEEKSMSLPKYTALVTLLVVCIIGYYQYSKLVFINSNEWICSKSDTIGINARCIEYQIKNLRILPN